MGVDLSCQSCPSAAWHLFCGVAASEDCIRQHPSIIVQNSAPAGNLGAAEVSKDDSNEYAALGSVEGGMVM